MPSTVARLDKSLSASLTEGHGTITIRVVVVDKALAAASAPDAPDTAPADAEADEALPDNDKRPVASFLEEPKRGRQCCVFLINGQRQHAWDNQFIVRDLEFKYLRNRTVVVVDCDGLKPEAVAELMQGSRHQFYEGTVYSALESRVIATLKGDPDLRRLEEEAEDEISSLQAGDEAVKAALDQLIEAHHDMAAHVDHGHTQPGDASRDSANGTLVQSRDVVVEGDPSVGVPSNDPVLQIRPDVATVRLKPNERRRFMVHPRPEAMWKALESHVVTFDPPVKELQVARASQLGGEELSLTFVEPSDIDEDEYPIETTLRCTAVFKGMPEPRVLERRVVINPGKTRPPKPPIPLKDDPTFIRVTSRQPIKLLIGGADVHVKLRWDGKDELAAGASPAWVFRVSCESPSVEPQTFLTRPSQGRFELLIQAAPGLKSGEQLKFDVEAVGPGKTLSTAFLADVVEPPTARKISAKVVGGGHRRPPYDLRYVERKDWDKGNCWGQPWTGGETGSFEAPSTKSPLTIFINQDMDLLATYRDALVAKKLAEATIKQRINKYTTHVAFHLYQMYEKKRLVEAQPDSALRAPTEDQMRDEIQRVAKTLIKLMEVAG